MAISSGWIAKSLRRASLRGSFMSCSAELVLLKDFSVTVVTIFVGSYYCPQFLYLYFCFDKLLFEFLVFFSQVLDNFIQFI